MMKKLILLLAILCISFGCEKNIIGDFDANAVPPYVTDDAVNKKGVAFTNRAKDWSFKTSDMGAHWMYSWGNELREEIPENVEFVPMFWGKGSVNDENINRIKQLVDEGKVKYVLGFNEPDGAAQANMSVDEAIALWPRLEEIGVPLGSPATVSPNNAWMVDFMQKAEANNLRIDFIAVHHYGGSDVMNMVNKLKNTYEAYGKPIWITEFAVADWSAGSPAANKYSEAEVMAFMEQGLQALDEIEWIHRYAWFDTNHRQPQLYSSSLFDEDSNMTPVGQKYADHKPNAEIGPGTETVYVPPFDPDELITNGGFESGEISPWKGFKNQVSTTNPNTGNFCGRIENNDGSLFTVAPVEEGETYIFKFQSRWQDDIPNTFKPVFRNNQGNALLQRLNDVPKSKDWVESSVEYVIPAGVSELKIVFFKGKVNPTFPQFFLDDVSLKKKK